MIAPGCAAAGNRERRRRFFRSCAPGRIAKMHGKYATRRKPARSYHLVARPEENPYGQGARYLRDRRGVDAHRDHRPVVRLRRGAAGPDSRQGPRAQLDFQLLVCAHHAHSAESPHGPPRRRAGERPGRARHAGGSCRHREAAQDRAAGGGGPRLRDRFWLEGLPEVRRDFRDQTTGGSETGSALPQTLFTPSTKAAIGDHDETISFDVAASSVGAELAARVRDTAIALYEYAASHARQRGIIIADTKFEFAQGAGGELVLIDEVLTPDSSRFWPADTYRGQAARPPSTSNSSATTSRRSTGTRSRRDRSCHQRSSPGPARSISRRSSA